MFDGFLQAGVLRHGTVGPVDCFAGLAEGSAHAAQDYAAEKFTAAGVFKGCADFAEKRVGHVQHVVDRIGQTFHLDGAMAIQHPGLKVAVGGALASFRGLLQKNSILFGF